MNTPVAAFIRSTKEAVKRFLYRHSTHVSQQGQDFWVSCEVFNEKRGGYFVDIGANDGVSISNTYLLERKYGWQGICVEANPGIYNLLKRNRRVTCENVCIDQGEGVVTFVLKGALGGIVDEGLDNTPEDRRKDIVEMPTVPLEQVLIRNGAPTVIDYLSVDVEGAEERVLSGFPFHEYLFRCITIERASANLVDILQGNGYVLIKKLPALDSFFVHKSFFEDYRRNLFSYYKKIRFTFTIWDPRTAP